MTELARYEQAFRRIICELMPYLEEVVIIGGWVPYLYKKYGGFHSWATSISLTAEVDVLVDRPLPPAGRPLIREILQAADFQPVAGEGGLAVWVRDVEAGEKLEFLIPHRGTGRQEGTIVPITEQNGIAAIPLAGLELMQRFKRKLAIPIPTTKGVSSVEIWVPMLGAYVVNKATTFARRQGLQGGGNPKRPKDLLYLRDLMAAGTEIVERIESDLDELVHDRGTRRMARENIRHARNTLDLALGGALQRELPEVAQMLKEREPEFTLEAASADIRGHLTDLFEILDDYAG